jgi:hypothetical protein
LKETILQILQNYYVGQLAVVGAIVVGGIFHFSSLALFYQEVEGSITETKVMCFIRDGKRTLRTSTLSSDPLFMDCNAAPAIAKEKGYSPGSVQKGTVYEVTWVSPVDGSVHKAEKYATGVGGRILIGNKKKLYASKYDPEKMQWN